MGRGERKFLLEMGRSQVGFIMGHGTFLKSLYIIGCSFCCSVSLAEWVMMLHLMCYFTLLNDNNIYHLRIV